MADMFERGINMSEKDKEARIYPVEDVKDSVIARTKDKTMGTKLYAKFIKFKEAFIDRVRIGSHKYFIRKNEEKIEKLEQERVVANENGLKNLEKEKNVEIESRMNLIDEHEKAISTIEEKQQAAHAKIEELDRMKQQQKEFKTLMKAANEKASEQVEQTNVEVPTPVIENADTTVNLNFDESNAIDTSAVDDNNLIEEPVVMPEVEEEANRVLEEQVNNVAEGVQEVMDNNSENKNIEVSSEQDVDVKPVQEEQKVENDINSEKNSSEANIPSWLNEISNATKKMNDDLAFVLKNYTRNVNKAVASVMKDKDDKIALEREKNSALNTQLQDKDKMISALNTENAKKDQMLQEKEAEIAKLHNDMNAMSSQFEQMRSIFANLQSNMSAMYSEQNNITESENNGKSMIKS